LKRHTSRTITDPALLLGELENVLRKGYAVDDQEHDAGVMEIAAPVFDSQGIVIGALSILGPEMRLAGIRLESEFLPLLCQSALRLSISLGYQRPETSGSERSCSIPGQGEKKRPLKAKPFGMGGLKTCC
jgi:DNA-binding IclR family transcriptional regulator